MYTLLGVAVLFMTLGIMIRFFKCYWLIAGYNTMSKEEKEQVDIEGLARYVSNFVFVVTGIFIFSAIMQYVGYKWIVFGAIFSIFPLAILVLIKSQRFEVKNQGNGSMSTMTKLTIGSVVLTVLVIGTILSFSIRPSQFVFIENGFTIKGSYSVSISYDEIASYRLIDELPQIKTRTNGVSVGNIRKGNFILEEIGIAKLFIYTGVPPYVQIVTKDESQVFFNDSDAESTRNIYRKLQMNVQN